MSFYPPEQYILPSFARQLSPQPSLEGPGGIQSGNQSAARAPPMGVSIVNQGAPGAYGVGDRLFQNV